MGIFLILLCIALIFRGIFIYTIFRGGLPLEIEPPLNIRVFIEAADAFLEAARFGPTCRDGCRD